MKKWLETAGRRPENRNKVFDWLVLTVSTNRRAFLMSYKQGHINGSSWFAGKANRGSL